MVIARVSGASKPHLVGAGRVVLMRWDDLLERVRVLGEARERTDEPAVAHAALSDVIGA